MLCIFVCSYGAPPFSIITKVSFILDGSYVMLNALQNCINYARLSLSDKGIKFCGFTLAAAHKTKPKPFRCRSFPANLPAMISLLALAVFMASLSAELSTLKARQGHNHRSRHPFRSLDSIYSAWLENIVTHFEHKVLKDSHSYINLTEYEY